MPLANTADAARRAVTLASTIGTPATILGLAGPPGAGKSTLAAAILKYASQQIGQASVASVPLDGFHLSNVQLQWLGRQNRKGAADTFDVRGYIALLSRLRANAGEDIYAPDYDRRLHEPIAARLCVPGTARLVVTEGNYLGLDRDPWSAVRNVIDHLWYVDAPDNLLLERLIARQMAGGRHRAAAEAWVEQVDRPNIELVKTTRSNCDWIVTPI